MGKFILKRILLAIPMLFVISIICFFIIKAAPGSPVQMYMTPGMNHKQVEIIRENLGLNRPIITQYIEWLKQILQGNLGNSLVSSSSVAQEITSRIIPTLILSGISMILTFIAGIGLGVIGGMNRKNFIGKIIDIFSNISIAMPSFLLALILIVVFTVKFNILPSVGMYNIGDKSITSLIAHLIMPVFAVVLTDIGGIIQYVKNSIEIEAEKDYVRTAFGKGLDRESVFYGHILKNSILPVITLVGLSLPSLVMGSVVIEEIFGWPGVGRMAYNAAISYDYPAIMATTLLAAVLLIIGNLISDILYTLVDPRVKGGLK
ncbi:ABC transporter permease [uncultured Clostridium sp.]|jgi:peptide/nickel transport system permease protein|uniref:ABC transporter permease n=1 Tax=uncultured Clostridium sp. TaxID=59620 RepID=UPI00263777AB|nr:ABC transporter permease [uncultured Clostridium sp.]